MLCIIYTKLLFCNKTKKLRICGVFCLTIPLARRMEMFISVFKKLSKINAERGDKEKIYEKSNLFPLCGAP